MKIRRNRVLRESNDGYIPTKIVRKGTADFEVDYVSRKGYLGGNITNLSFSNYDNWFPYIYENLPQSESEELFRRAVEEEIELKEIVIEKDKKYHITGKCIIACNYYGGFNFHNQSGTEFWIKNSSIIETKLTESIKSSRKHRKLLSERDWTPNIVNTGYAKFECDFECEFPNYSVITNLKFTDPDKDFDFLYKKLDNKRIVSIFKYPLEKELHLRGKGKELNEKKQYHITGIAELSAEYEGWGLGYYKPEIEVSKLKIVDTSIEPPDDKPQTKSLEEIIDVINPYTKTDNRFWGKRYIGDHFYVEKVNETAGTVDVVLEDWVDEEWSDFWMNEVWSLKEYFNKVRDLILQMYGDGILSEEDISYLNRLGL